jgi:ABC-2 type transport system permease protein
MTALLHAELLKLRTLRSTAWALLALLGIVGATVLASLSDAGSPGFRSPESLREPLLALGYLTALTIALLAATATAGEFRHRTISQRYLASPGRVRVLAVKLVTYAVVAIVVTAAVVGLTIAIETPALAGKDLTLGLGGPELARLAGGVLIAAGLLTTLGVVVGMATRNATTAVVAIFGTLLGEKIAGGLLGDVGHFLPFTLVESVLGLGGPTPWGLAALLLGMASALAAVATARLLVPRDVT